MDLTDSQDVAAPAAIVFDALTDLVGMGRLSPENTGGAWLDGFDGPALGARFEGTNRQGDDEWSTIATVTAYEPPATFVFDVTYDDEPISQWHFSVTPTATGCRVTEAWTDLRATAMREDELAEGFDRAAFTVGSIRTTLERLAALCEQSKE